MKIGSEVASQIFGLVLLAARRHFRLEPAVEQDELHEVTAQVVATATIIAVTASVGAPSR